MNARRYMLALLLLNAVGWAETTSLPLTDDAQIANDVPPWLNANINYGDRPQMRVHNWGPFYSLVRFDASAISGMQIQDATLNLYLSGLKSPGNVSVHSITSGWSEATVTWNTQPSFTVDETMVVSFFRDHDRRSHLYRCHGNCRPMG